MKFVMKWIVSVLLCLIVPPIGIPIIGYLIWKQMSDRKFEENLDKISGKFGPIKTDFLTRQDYLNELEISLNRLENLWRKSRLFEPDGLCEELGPNRSYVFDGEQYWSLNRYQKDCRELLRNPIPELVEQWQEFLSSHHEFAIEIRNILHTRAKCIKGEIISQMEQGVDWKSLAQKHSNDGFEVTRENGVWTVSYETALMGLYGPEFALTNRPNYVSFEIK